MAVFCYNAPVMHRRIPPAVIGVGTMLGYIVGVGIFGVPYAYVRGGVWWGVGVTVLAGIVLSLIHLMFAQLLAVSGGEMREVGIVGRYLGGRWRAVALGAATLGIYGGLLAYTIAAGRFADVLMPAPLQFGSEAWSYLCFAVFMAFLAPGRAAMVRVEAILTFVLLAAIVGVLAVVAPHVQPENITWLAPRGIVGVFGVAVYALGGIAAVPTVLEVMAGNRRGGQRAVVIGTLLALALTVAFGLVVAGASGLRTTEEAVRGLIPVTGEGIVRLAALFGLMGIATSFLPLATYLHDVYRLDLKVPTWSAWLLTLLPPLLLFASGERSFIRVIGFTGAVLVGIGNFLLIWSYLRARRTLPVQKRALLRVPEGAAVCAAAVVILGAAAEVFTTVWPG